MNNLRCPQCGLSHTKRNGHTHYGKQNYRCKDCDRQFVWNRTWAGGGFAVDAPDVHFSL